MLEDSSEEPSQDIRLDTPLQLGGRRARDVEVHWSDDAAPPADDMVYDNEAVFKEPQPKRKRQSRIERDVLEMQTRQEPMILRLPFTRLVRDISIKFSGVTEAGEPKLQWHIDALTALQEATEAYMVELFADATHCTEHAKRVTLFIQDVQLVRKLRGHTTL